VGGALRRRSGRRLRHSGKRGLEIEGPNELLYAAEGSLYLQQAFLVADKTEYVQRMEVCGKRSLDLNPDSARGHFLWGLIELDPLVPPNHMMPGWLAELKGRFQVSLERKRALYESEPENPWYRFLYAWILTYNERTRKAMDVVETIARDNPESPYAWQGLFVKHALLGNREEALQLVASEERKREARDEAAALFLGECCALLGEPELALEWLETATACNFINYPFLAEHDPLLAPLRGRKDFQRMMKRVKRPWEGFEA